MRKVSGPTDKVIVVGAGLGGLSAALRLAGAGRDVTIVERESVPGGRNGLIVDQECHVAVFERCMGVQQGVVRLDDGRSNLAESKS